MPVCVTPVINYLLLSSSQFYNPLLRLIKQTSFVLIFQSRQLPNGDYTDACWASIRMCVRVYTVSTVYMACVTVHIRATGDFTLTHMMPFFFPRFHLDWFGPLKEHHIHLFFYLSFLVVFS